MRLRVAIALPRQANFKRKDSRFNRSELPRDHNPKRRQMVLDGDPYVRRGDILVIVAVDVARAGHFFPCDCLMPRL